MAKSFLSRLLSSLRIFPASATEDRQSNETIAARNEEQARQWRPGPFSAPLVRAIDGDAPTLMLYGGARYGGAPSGDKTDYLRRRGIAEKNMKASMAEKTRMDSRRSVSFDEGSVHRPVDFPSTQDMLIGLTAYSLMDHAPSSQSCSDSNSYSSSDSSSSSYDSGSCSSD